MAKQKPLSAPDGSMGTVDVAAAAGGAVTEVTGADGATVTTSTGSDTGAGPDVATTGVAAGSSAALAGDVVVTPEVETVDEPVLQSGGDQAPTVEPLPMAKVRALVLSDNAFGRCGEVREFNAEDAPAIEAGGFIDTHPNAVAAAEKE